MSKGPCQACGHQAKHHKKTGRCTRKCGCRLVPVPGGNLTTWSLPRPAPFSVSYTTRPIETLNQWTEEQRLEDRQSAWQEARGLQ